MLATQFYFKFGMVDFLKALRTLSVCDVSEQLRHVGRSIFNKYSSWRVVQGRLIRQKYGGCSPTKNPSERRNGSWRYFKLIQDWEETVLLGTNICNYLRHCSDHVSLSTMLDMMSKTKSCNFSGTVNYKNVRCCRMFVASYNKNFCNSEKDWLLFTRMSRHVTERLQQLGLKDWALTKNLWKHLVLNYLYVITTSMIS